jgi:CheY-like chemotaxis protein
MPKTLLLADDSVTIQKVVGISFANEDVVLLTVDNGDDAIARAREARPDLVLADVMMPGKDGYEVCEAIKTDRELRHVPVLLLSGTFEPFDEERARRAGADGHITKPFEAQALVDRVNELLARGAQSVSDATVVVSEAPANGSEAAFDFFEEEFAQTAPSPPPSARDLASGDDGIAAGEPLELEAAVMEEEGGAEAEVAAEFDEDVSPVDPRATVAILDDDVSAPAGSPEQAWGGAPRERAAHDTPLPFFGEDFDETSLSSETETATASARPGSVAGAPNGYEESFDFGFEESRAETAAPGRSPFAAASPSTVPVAEPPPLPPTYSATETELFDERIHDAFAEEGELPDRHASHEASRPSEHETGSLPLTPLPLPTPPPVPPVARTEPPRELSEALRTEFQQTLEKIAWEAFGDLSERIVREALERVEQVAWEVIPQMAETLIREEIRRLKGSD